MKLWMETLMVAGFGVLFGLVANSVSPRGLELGRNYFPGGGSPPPSQVSAAPVAGATSSGTNLSAAPAEPAVFARLRAKGLSPMTLAEVRVLHADPRFGFDQIVFLDDRDHDYAEGHVPGAFQFFHYRAPEFLPALMPVLMSAEKIVVYCTGGNCEDSEFAALMLAEIGIPKEKLAVFVGGIKEWKAAGLKVETGARKSGVLVTPEK